MAVSRVDLVQQKFFDHLKKLEQLKNAGELRAEGFASAYPTNIWTQLFESQLTSRLLDYESRALKETQDSFYTIGSAGHEGNVTLGYHLRPTDPTLLHYRSGALFVERLRKDPAAKTLESILLSFCASSEDPVSGGRHKVWGSKSLWMPPQTSTIASQLPKALGMAVSVERAKHLKRPLEIPADSIVCVSFGDASLNHSVAQGAINSALWVVHQKLPVPLLFLCEDNGIGISVKTPRGWVAQSMSARPHLKYFYTDGLNLKESFDVAEQAVRWCRQYRQPVFLHMRTVRLLGHAGSDVETEYLTKDEIDQNEALDPLHTSATFLVREGILSAGEIKKQYENLALHIHEVGQWAKSRPKLDDAEKIMECLAPYHSESVEQEAKRATGVEVVASKPRHMAMVLNQGLQEILTKYPESLLFGEDVAKKGGVYHVTTGLFEKFGAGRVFNTLLDETTILGLAIGAGHLGFLPIPEIQYLAYYHNAEDQIRGEAASLQFFSNGQYKNPMVIRVASFAYQRGFGGHFHNDHSIGAIRDVPGIIAVTPSRGDDAVKLLRTAMALAKVDGRIVFFHEPIALYMTKDLYESGDGLWQTQFPAPNEVIALGEVGVYHPDHQDILILSYANGLYMSLRVAKLLKERYHIHARVIDLRWLVPLPEKAILAHLSEIRKVVIVDECRKTGGGISEGLMTLIQEKTMGVEAKRVTALDTYIPLGSAAYKVLPSEEDILQACLGFLS